MRIVHAIGFFCGSLFLLETAWAASPDDLNTPRLLQLVPSGTLRPSAANIVSWNIDRGTDLRAITEELRREHPAICVFQEVDWGTKRTGSMDVATELARSLHLNMAYGIEFEELSQQSSGRTAYIGQATLTRLPIRKARVLRFKTQSGFWKPHAWIPSAIPLMQRRVGGRIALVTELEFRGRPLVIYNLHLESRSYGRLQIEQLNEILQDAKRYGPEIPTMIAGDLNSKYLPSTYLKKMQQQGFRSALGNRIERTHTIAMALDWIFVRGPVQLKDGRVRKDIKGSDHYPISAELSPEPKKIAR